MGAAATDDRQRTTTARLLHNNRQRNGLHTATATGALRSTALTHMDIATAAALIKPPPSTATTPKRAGEQYGQLQWWATVDCNLPV
jgi:hypothetical protein